MKALTEQEAGYSLKIAPLIDIVFNLIIFFLVATTIYEQERDITIKLAQAGAGQERKQRPAMVIVNINKSGVIVMDERVRTLEELEDTLANYRKEQPDLLVVVRCDRSAMHKYFVDVLNVCEKVKVGSVAVATLFAPPVVEQ